MKMQDPWLRLPERALPALPAPRNPQPITSVADGPLWAEMPCPARVLTP